MFLKWNDAAMFEQGVMKVILAVWEVFGDELTDEHMNRLELIFTPKNIPPKVKNSKMGLNNIFWDTLLSLAF